MPHLTVSILTSDDVFRREVIGCLRAGDSPVLLVDERRLDIDPPDLAVVDLRSDPQAGLATVERLCARMPSGTIFAAAEHQDLDLVLAAMRAGANEFLEWPARSHPNRAAASEGLRAAARRALARRADHTAARRSTTLAFFGAKGGAGTTTLAVNCAVNLCRLTHRSTIIVDLKPSLGEVMLFLGVQPRFTVVDALDNLHRLDDGFLAELVTKHESGVHALAGSQQADRPAAADAPAIEYLLGALAQRYDFIVVDAGNALGAPAFAAFHASDSTVVVTTPDVPATVNAQAIVDRLLHLGLPSDRVQVVLNRYAEHLTIGPRQIESAIGRPVDHMFSSDYRTVSTALNCGVPLTLVNGSKISSDVERFTRHIVAPLPAPDTTTGGLHRLFALFHRTGGKPCAGHEAAEGEGARKRGGRT